MIQVEGHQGRFPVLHPQLGEITTDPRFRRAMVDFPPLAWFTSQLEVPHCLISTTMITERDGQTNEIELDEAIANAMTLHRLALAFRAADIPVVRWPDHPGYNTAEGRGLNETARDAGDDPDEWWVSESSVDVMQVQAVYVSWSIFRPKLVRSDRYLPEIKRMVQLCRDTPGAFIPPTWLKPHEAQALAAGMNVPALG